MADILTFFLIISTLFTGIFWFYYRIICIKKYIFNKKIDKKYIKISLKNSNKKDFFQSFSSFFPVFLIVFIIRSFIYEPFQIPSGSMMPTLLIGDFILVDKFSYGIRNPITHRLLIKKNHPKRGDIVVFKHPINGNNYIKRVIGLPGDQIVYNMKTKHITISNQCNIPKKCQRKILVHYSKLRVSKFFQKIYFLNKKNVNQEKTTYNSSYFYITQEEIDGFKHDILLLNGVISTKRYYHQKGIKKLTWIVPKNKYFMMGDNRDNSLDSRYWGFVSENNLIGKATAIWMSIKKNENYWPVGIRLNRIGGIY